MLMLRYLIMNAGFLSVSNLRTLLKYLTFKIIDYEHNLGFCVYKREINYLKKTFNLPSIIQATIYVAIPLYHSSHHDNL